MSRRPVCVKSDNVMIIYVRMSMLAVDFFFQAEDGIRDSSVTGVQTCALPISYTLLRFDFLGRERPNFTWEIWGKTVEGGGGSNKPGRQFGTASCMAVKAQHWPVYHNMDDMQATPVDK